MHNLSRVLIERVCGLNRVYVDRNITVLSRASMRYKTSVLCWFTVIFYLDISFLNGLMARKDMENKDNSIEILTNLSFIFNLRFTIGSDSNAQ